MAPEVLEKAAKIEDVLHDAAKVKEMVTEAVEVGVRSAMRAIKQGRIAAEDALDDAKLAVRKNPFEAVGIGFAAGVLIGGLIFWMVAPRRK
jgi:ElaB/YqjD/DUF883 family membrane-anchored ribosome-binding protein